MKNLTTILAVASLLIWVTVYQTSKSRQLKWAGVAICKSKEINALLSSHIAVSKIAAGDRSDKAMSYYESRWAEYLRIDDSCETLINNMR